jgi:hypothetical protein
LQWPSWQLRAARRPGERCEDVLAVGLHRTQSLADQAGRTEQPAKPGERVLDYALTRALERLVRLEEPKASPRSKNPGHILEHGSQRLTARHRVIEYHRIEWRGGGGRHRTPQNAAAESPLGGERSRSLRCAA